MRRAAGAVAASPWGGGLVLRGSLPLKVWLGGPAREPGDLDWVVTPPTAAPDDAWPREMFRGLPGHIAGMAGDADLEWLPGRAAWDDIWTYDRAPGRRLVMPWSSPGLPPGFVQMDFVFNATLWDDPVPLRLGEGDDADSPTIRAASPELSLAWKIQWLESDSYPQGKDLHDAVLLAERFRPRLELLDLAIAEARGKWSEYGPDLPLHWTVDWEEFVGEYPWVGGDASDWKQRLTAALSPCFLDPALPARPRPPVGGGLSGREPTLRAPSTPERGG
jgi:hypothetical protein